MIPQTKFYKKLSAFGVFLWFGILISISIIVASANLVGTECDGIIPIELTVFALMSLLVFFLLTACSDDGIYSKYRQPPEFELFSVSGRLSRSGFLCYFLVVFTMFCIISTNIPIKYCDDLFIHILILLPFNIAFCTACIRRAQDCGFSPWFPFIPIIALILLFFSPSDEDNEYGPTSKNTKIKLKTTKAEKIKIVNTENYLNRKKADRIKYLQNLRKQTSLELKKLHAKLEEEKNKLKDMPKDIASYIKPNDTSDLVRNIFELENKITAIDELIKSETTKEKPEQSYEEYI